MGRKNEAAAAAAPSGKPKATPASKDKVKDGAGKGLSVADLLGGNKKVDKQQEKNAAAMAAGGKAKSSKSSSYMGDVDLPPSDEEGEEEVDSEEDLRKQRSRARGNTPGALKIAVSDKEQKKREKKEMLVAHAVEIAKQEALKDDRNAFTVVVGSKASVLDGEETADANVKDISIENFSVAARGKELLRNATVKISHGRRYGLVGPNGKGKSTLLKLLAWRQIPVPRNIDILLVEQEVIGDETPALQAVVNADEELMKLRQEAERLQKLSLEEEEGEDDDKGVDEAMDVSEKMSTVYEKLRSLDSDAAEARASKILAGLGFTKEMQVRSTKSFSGGWRMRISLARALFLQPTLLLLDEPTNHLDLRAVLWLEEYLMRWKKTLVVVSHDRDFLDSVCTDIIHLHDEQLHLYKGNFSAFEEAYEQKRTANNKKFEVYEKQEKAARRTGNKKAVDKVKERAKYDAAKEAKAKGKSKAGAADADEIPIEPPRRWRDYTVSFHFPEPTELTPPLLQLIDVEFSYPGRPDFCLKEIDAGIDMGTRVAIVGPNGAGKSTLLNLLAGDLAPTKGQSRRSQKLRIGRYSQHFVDLLTMDETPVQYLLRLHPNQEGPSKQEAVRAKLGKFGLPSNNHLTPIVKLSGGQKARVVFTSISMSNPHILLLDEPTNHLDMQSIDALAEALEQFSGGIVLVSHDSRLISRVCEDEQVSQIWVVDNGTVRTYNGSFDEYKAELVKEIVAEVEE